MKESIFLVFLLLGIATADIRISSFEDSVIPTHIAQNQPDYDGNIEAYEYYGEVTLDIQDDLSDGMQYFITFFPWQENCHHQKCYYGFVNNYTSKNEETQETEIIQAYGNQELREQPIFKFGVNSREDYSIKYNKDLDETMKQLIEVSCEKFNPVFDKSVSGAVAASIVNGKNIRNEAKAGTGQFEFEEIEEDDEEQMKYGSRIAQKTEKIDLEDTDFQESVESQKIIQRNDGMVGSNKQSYSFNLGQNSDQELVAFDGDVVMVLNFQQKIYLPLSDAAEIIIEIEDSDDYVELNAIELQKERDVEINLPQVQTIDVSQGINDEEEYEDGQNNAGRLLQATKGIFDQRKTIYSKSILGKTFKVDFRADCDMVSSGKSVRCKGWVYFVFFGHQRSYKIIDLTRRVDRDSNYKRTPFKNSLTIPIRIGLPRPRVLSFNFNINIGYEINFVQRLRKTSSNPLKFEIVHTMEGKITTDSTASIRVLLVRGGVFITGSLFQAKAQSKIIGAFNSSRNRLSIKIRWYAERRGFNARWGFFYQVRRFRKWGPRRDKGNWSITSSPKRWDIFKKDLTLRL